MYFCVVTSKESLPEWIFPAESFWIPRGGIQPPPSNLNTVENIKTLIKLDGVGPIDNRPSTD